eukprot:3076893-Pyramimonas_sp.AAC.1
MMYLPQQSVQVKGIKAPLHGRLLFNVQVSSNALLVWICVDSSQMRKLHTLRLHLIIPIFMQVTCGSRGVSRFTSFTRHARECFLVYNSEYLTGVRGRGLQ